jgi:F-type H+-transporting ATPase subunit b
MTEQGLVHDTHFWVLLATIAFAVLAYVKGRAPLLSMLDGRTARIKTELEDAERLKVEAQDLLAESQKKHRDAIHTAQKIIDGAKDTAERIEKETVAKMEESLKRREAQLMDRIARAESAAVAELRTQAADLASRAAERLLADNAAKQGAKLVDEAISDITKAA